MSPRDTSPVQAGDIATMLDRDTVAHVRAVIGPHAANIKLYCTVKHCDLCLEFDRRSAPPLRPLEAWHDDDGCVLWWSTDGDGDPPHYVGSPGDSEWPGDDECAWWIPIPPYRWPTAAEADAPVELLRPAKVDKCDEPQEVPARDIGLLREMVTPARLAKALGDVNFVARTGTHVRTVSKIIPEIIDAIYKEPSPAKIGAKCDEAGTMCGWTGTVADLEIDHDGVTHCNSVAILESVVSCPAVR